MTFIEQQEELAQIKATLVLSKEPWDMSYDLEESQKNLNTLITQIIHNTGAELLRLAEGERISDIGYAKNHPDTLEDIRRKEGGNQAIDTLKQHITNVTGAE